MMKDFVKKAGQIIAVLCLSLLVLGAEKMEALGADTRQITELDGSKAAQNNGYEKAIFCEARNGIYFLKTVGEVYSNQQSYELIFYDIAAKTYQTVYSYDRAETAYSSAEAVYFLESSSKSEGNDQTSYDIVITRYDLNSGAVSEIKPESLYSSLNWAGFIDAIGVDQKGRIYLTTQDKEIYLFSADGTLLDQKSLGESISQFYGFDPVNGNFYYCGTYNWRYWGFDHSMASLMAGNVDENNKVSITGQNLAILYQYGFFGHTTPVAMLNQRYLAVLSTFSGDLLTLVDSNSYDYRDYTEQSTSINILDSSVSVSPFNVSDTSVIKLAAYTEDSEYENDWDVSSAGTRCVLAKNGNSLIIKTEKCVLTEYDIAAQKKVIQAVTSHPVYDLAMYGDTCVVLEKEDGHYYVETFAWTAPSDFTAEIPSAMNVGDSSVIKCTAGGAFLLDYTFESSNPKVLDVDERGRLNAWTAGTAVITVKAPALPAVKQFTVTVKERAGSGADVFSVTYTKGASSTTIHRPGNSGYYGTVTEANLTQKPDGSFERVELIDSKVLIESYSSSLTLKSKKNLACELPLFGGYYSGDQYNFLVFGQNNPKEKDSVEVIRVVKYDKSWKRIGACAIKGANTYEPFEAGGLDMTEAGGNLYVHTCHTMYASSDGLHHQANCIFKIQESNMSLQDSYSDVMNLSSGYVSHSFMQLIETDGTYIYRADLGDAYPRGIALTATRLTDKVDDPEKYGTVVTIPGNTGNNYTGFALGGLKLSADSYILSGAGIQKTSDKNSNIWVCASAKDEWKENTNWITKYSASGNVSAGVPRLVKLNENQFLLMWEEHNSKKNTYVTKMALLNPSGKLASDIYQTSLALSACEPIVTASGRVVWYVTDNGAPAFISIDPYHLAGLQKQSKDFQLFKDKTGTTEAKTVTYKSIKYTVTGSGKVKAAGPVKKSLKTAVIPASFKVSGKTYKVTAISKKAFAGCKKLTSVTIGSNVTQIGAQAFSRCTALKKAVVGKKVKSIGKAAFSGCKKLRSVTLKTAKLTSGKVGSGAFKGIHAKAVVKVPKSKYKSYKTMLKKKGLPSKVKVKKS